MLGTLAKRGAQTAVAAIGGVSAAMGGIAAYAVKVGTSFEVGMSEVAAISGATASELEKLTDKAKEMGAKTKFSATESAEAFKYMAMAGWQTGDMLNGIEGIMNLAAASGEDLASVSDIVTDALTAFGLQAKDSAHFADVLAQASSRSNTNVGLMGYTFKYVAPVAGALGYSIEDMAVAIGLMANAGIKGEQAGTQLRGVLSRMSLPTEKVQTAMDKLGLSLTDSEGNMKSFAEVMQDMRAGFSKLTDAEKTTYSDRVIKSAEETRDATIAAADEQYTNQLVLAEQACTENGVLNKRRYDEMAASAKAEYDLAINSANALYGDTVAIVNQGYLDRSNAAKSFLGATAKHNLEYEQEMRRFNAETNRINTELWEDTMASDSASFENKKKHTAELARIQEEYLANLDEQTQEEVGIWLAQLANTDLYGGKITDENQRYLDEFMAAYDGLPEEAKDTFSKTMQGMLTGMQEKEPALYAKASSLANGVISRLNKTFDIHSPSRKTRKIFKQVIQGGEVGVDEQKPKLMQKVKGTAESVLSAFGKSDAWSRAFARMRSVASSITDRFTAPVQIRTEQQVALMASSAERDSQVGDTAGSRPKQVVTHLSINGREFAIATTPYIEEEMAFE